MDIKEFHGAALYGLTATGNRIANTVDRVA
jgi:hypothetical protein